VSFRSQHLACLWRLGSIVVLRALNRRLLLLLLLLLLMEYEGLPRVLRVTRPTSHHLELVQLGSSWHVSKMLTSVSQNRPVRRRIRYAYSNIWWRQWAHTAVGSLLSNDHVNLIVVRILVVHLLHLHSIFRNF
jgi:hypothetical protein